MSVPITYDNTTLAGYMHRVLGQTGLSLGWDVVVDYQEPIYDTLFAYGVESLAEATDIRKLRTLARREVWRAVMQATAGHIDVTLDAEAFKQSQIHAHAQSQYEAAAREASDAGYDPKSQPAAYVQPVEYLHDPYDHRRFDERKIL